MATITASPPGNAELDSPQLNAKAKSPSLPPLMTSTPIRRTSSNRPTSFAQRRISSYSTKSRSNAPESRPISQVFPAFHSSLSYTFVRDFAYLASHPLHYGPQPDASGVATPASERSRRLSDPNLGGWEDSRNQWSAGPPWLADTNYNSNRDQLPAMTFNDGGPPYSEDEDLRSPVVTSKSRHKKSRSNAGERGRSPGAAGTDRGMIVDSNGEQIEEYHPADTDELDGPGGEIETYARREPYHRDSNFAKPLQRYRSPYETYREPVSEEDRSEEDEEDDDENTRFSKDYSFTIASPDEEMHGKAIVLFDFVPEHDNELPLKEGQIILVSYRQIEGWLVAEDPQSGESGLVPEVFVRLMKHIEGGEHGLNAVVLDDTTMTPVSPTNKEPFSVVSQSQSQPQDTNDMGGHTPRPSNGGSWPAVQSNFSTSSRDFSPLKREASATSPDKD